MRVCSMYTKLLLLLLIVIIIILFEEDDRYDTLASLTYDPQLQR